MILDEVVSLDALEALAPEWSQLFERCPGTTVFQSPEWLLPWWRHLGGGELIVLAVRQDGLLAAVAPLFVWGLPPEPRTVSLMGAGVTDYLDFLAAPEHEAEATALLLDHLAAIRSRWGVCELTDLPDHSPVLRAPCPANLSAERSCAAVCPALRLPDRSGSVLSNLTASMRRNLRKARSKLESEGPVRFEIAGPATLPRFCDALFRLHRARWQSRGGGVLGESRILSFHREAMARMLRGGKLRLHVLLWKDEIIAAVYALVHGDCVYAYLGGFEPGLEVYSPGTVPIAQVLEQSIAEGKKTFDFLRGAEPYKYSWGAVDRLTYRMQYRYAV
jgi:CelD/BcsL family acetyltransferase involved in cellulose biosynthesis